MVLRSLLLLAAIAPLPARAATFVVNLTTDESDPDPNDGTPDVDLATDGLQVTLRSAIEFSNSSTGADEITFQLTSRALMPAELPEITDTLRIDGYMFIGTALLQGRGLVIRSPGCTIANFAIDAAPIDALLSFESIVLTEVELTNSVLGFGVRSRGNVSLTGGVISSNAKGGVLSWEGSASATGAMIESNGGPGIMSLRGVTMTALADDPIRIRANGGGLYTSGPVNLGGAGLHEIAGNFGDGIRTINGVNVSSPVQIVDNASFGVRSYLSINLGATATVTGNGHGFFATVPNEIGMDPTFTVLMNDDVRGGGLFSANGGIAGVEVVASDNGGPGILSRSDVAFERAIVARNDGHGIETNGSVDIVFARVEGNFGIGILSPEIVDVLSHAIIENNTSAGVFSRSIFIHGLSPTEIRGNGKGGRASGTSYDETLAVSFQQIQPMTEGVRVELILWAFDIVVEDSGGDGVSCDTFEITDGRIRRNGNVGLRAVRGGSLTRTILCDNAGGDLVHFQPVDLDTESGACDREQRVAEEGCGCSTVPRGSGSILLLLLLFMRKRWLLLLAGCSMEQAFFTPPPPPEDASSVVFVVESDDEVKLEARPVAKGRIEPVTIEFDRLGRSQIWTLYYDQVLSQHGLEAGALRVEPNGAPLDRPDRIHRAEFAAGRVTAWSQESSMSPRLESLAVGRTVPPGPCLAWGEERIFELETHRDSAFALRYDGGRALIATDDARLYFVGVEGVTPLGVAAPVGIGAGYLANGDLILGGAGGRTFRGPVEPELALVEIAPGASGAMFRWMDGTSGELFAVTNLGALEHFDGSTWRVLFPAQGIDDWRRGVAWVAPNQAVAVGLSAPIVRASNGVVDVEPVDIVDALTSVEHVPGLGTFAGTVTGTVLLNRGDRWELIPDSPLELPATAMAGVEGGVVISGGTGRSTEWRDGYGFCGDFSVNSPIVKHMAVLDGAIVFLGDARDDRTDPTTVSVVLTR